MLTTVDIDKTFPWIRGVRRILASADMPRFTGTHMLVGSDYSGSHPKSGYLTYAFLLADADLSPEWPVLRQAVREKYLGHDRHMSFKGLNDSRKTEALVPFLRAADRFHGICVVFVVNRSIERLTTSPNSMDVWSRLAGFEGRWNPRAFETVCRIIHFSSFLIANMASPRQNVTWITDQDEIIANDDRHTDLLQLTARMSGLYLPFPLGELCIATPRCGYDDHAFEDFVAIPDLVAGSFAELFSTCAANADYESNGNRTLAPTSWSQKSQMITDWFYEDAHPLRRLAISIDMFNEELYVVQRVRRADA